MKKIYVGILAGGNGERLWPLSKKERPKQLLPFLNNQSLLSQTVDRVSMLTGSQENIFVITSDHQKDIIAKEVVGKIGDIVVEPCARNTGPAILLLAEKIKQKDPEGVLVVLPADHFIPDTKKCNSALQEGISYVAEHGVIATFGLMPTYGATGYGYIQADAHERVQLGRYYPVKKFHEKPDKKRAEEYLCQDDMFWNIGIFAGKVSTFIQEFKSCEPLMYDAMQKYLQGVCDYADIPSISIDYAIMEKTKNSVIFTTDFEWYDVGNLNIFLQLQRRFSSEKKQLFEIEAQNNICSSNKKVVACIGVDSLCIVETDDVLLIASRDKVEQVKMILQKVKEQNIDGVI